MLRRGTWVFEKLAFSQKFLPTDFRNPCKPARAPISDAQTPQASPHMTPGNQHPGGQGGGHGGAGLNPP
ncbi:hypothetical protein GWK47_042054 [Chionoecetes opilio]|uniref:Uncharacterized protein n=1 Tax=Chionoecetes opilio TaxID=41210 RepID=A0A8J4YBR5_CHIOP|nr:hypothetical protein GWK47_042054 [Chionoecetes opilio]